MFGEMFEGALGGMTDVPSPQAADRAKAFELTPVSRETEERLDRFVELLLTWQKTTHLISPSTIPKLWTRHVADSLQLLDVAPNARLWVDLGSGGGFPGVVIACAIAETPGAKVHLVESNTRKAAFLREAARVTGAPAVVEAMRIEKFVANFAAIPDVVTARALLPFKSLLDHSFSILSRGTLGLFPKGQDVAAELTQAAKYWNIDYTLAPSRTDSLARIVVVRGLERLQVSEY
jgi:16S rRNA (guanine527-N7)-methyltransferase